MGGELHVSMCKREGQEVGDCNSLDRKLSQNRHTSWQGDGKAKTNFVNTVEQEVTGC